MSEKDFKLNEDKLKSELEYQKNLNRLYESLIKMMIKILIDTAAERR